jgi:hypothetical protein
MFFTQDRDARNYYLKVNGIGVNLKSGFYLHSAERDSRLQTQKIVTMICSFIVPLVTYICN